MSHVQFAPAVSDDLRLAQKMLIGGEWVGALSGRTLPVYDPADGRMIVEVPDGGAADVDRAAAAARAAFAPNGPWRSMTPQERGKLIWKLADLGLGAAVWTRDISRAHRMAAAIESGQVRANCYQAADSALPFGGTKEPGWGRETCRGTLEEYLETKTVVVSL